MRGEISRQLQSSLQEFRNLEVKSLIEYPPVVSDTDTTISKIIGILKERNAYDIFIHLAGTACNWHKYETIFYQFEIFPLPSHP